MKPMRALLVTLAVACCLASQGAGAEPHEAIPVEIAAQPLARALAEFAAQTGLQLIYVSALVDKQQSIGAPAGLSPTDALSQLLTGTGLRFEFLNAKTVRILAVPPAPVATAGPRRLTRGDARRDVRSAAPDEVIVTANRREEQQSKVPISIATWTQESMAASGAKTIADLAMLTPGVEFDFYPDIGPGTWTNIAIRGVNSRDGTSTGMYLDDTPLRGDAGESFGRSFPFPFDVDRVEVLRGPQGTLLGDSAEGGAIRIISTEPSLTTSSGFSRAEFATTARGANSYEIGAAAGGPIVKEVIGFRGSAWYRSAGGFIDRVDPFTGALVERDVNRTIDESFRGALTFAVTDTLQITPSLAYQSHHAHDSSTFNPASSDPGAGVLRSDKILAQPVDDAFFLASLKITAALRSAELSSVTSYFRRDASAAGDGTNNGVDWGSPLGPEYPTSNADFLAGLWSLKQSTLSQELRLTSDDQEATVSWIAGGIFLHAFYSDMQVGPPHTTNTGRQVGDHLNAYDGDETQLAAFGEIRVRLGARVTANLGIRIERATYAAELISAALSDPAPPRRRAAASESPWAPRLGVTIRADDQNLFYASVTSGYRIGGVSPLIYPWCPDIIPRSYGPDAVWNYEFGSKNTLRDGRVQLDTSVFHMRWRNMQNVMPLACGSEYITNIGGAVSNGFDFTARALIGDRLRIGLAVGYADSHYTDTIVADGAVRVRAGDAVGSLPLVPSPWNVTASVEYQFPLSRGITGTARAEEICHSHNPGPFYSQDPESRAFDPAKRSDPATNVLNLRMTVRWSNFDAALAVDNALDSQPILLLRNAFARSTFFYATTLRPRTVSLSLHWRY
jgi:outer membrane receptor protein involved in Fe transport